MGVCAVFLHHTLVLKILSLAIINGAFLFTASSQELLKEIDKYNKTNYREELYLQTDRDIYIVGEQVWLKVYKLDAFTKKPNNISKVVYIELLNHTGYPVQQIKLRADKNSVSTNLMLSDTLGSGHYLLRAYTNWMKNFDEKDFAFKNISVINPFQKPDKTDFASNNGPNNTTIDSFLFYPEGGKLVAGIGSKVNFKALDRSGRLQKMNAALVNKKTDTLCLVVTENSGFGTFYIKPEKDENYNLLYSDKTGGIRSFPLGQIKDSGIVISLENLKKDTPFAFRINKSPGFNAPDQTYYLFLSTGGIVQFIKETALKTAEVLRLKKNNIPYGIMNLMITDKDGRILANRWFYNEPEDRLVFQVRLDKIQYGPREKVTGYIRAADQEGNPVETDLTLSVTKSWLINKNRINLDNRYKYYVSLRTGISVGQHADMNDNLIFFPGNPYGRNHFIVPDQIKKQNLPELEGKMISGTLKSYTTDKPLKNIDIVLSFIGKAAKCQFYKTNSDGSFYFTINETGLQEMVIQPLKSDLKDYYVELNPDFINSAHHFLPGSFNLDTGKLAELNESIISMQIKNIYRPFRQDYRNKKENPVLYSFYGKPVNTIYLADYIQLTSVREAIKEIVPYVYVKKKGGKNNFQFISNIYGLVLEKNPLVLVDGTPFNDIDQILNMNSSDLERIEVLNRRYLIDRHIFDGIIHFITRKGNLTSVDPGYPVFRQAYTCFHQSVNFSSPDYSTDSLKNSRLPDFRNTLYWNPGLHTQKDGTVRFEFYTSDEEGDYTLFMEGISPDGKTGKTVKRLNINH